MRLVGVGLLLVGAVTVWRLARRTEGHDYGARPREWTGAAGAGRYRSGPWPGLSPAGGLVVLGCALLLAGGQLVLGDPRQPLPDMPLLGILALSPMAVATRLVGVPGVGSAVCGAYLLPRSLLSLVDPGIEPPPLLLVPAVVFDLSVWLRAGDFAAFSRVTARVTARVTIRLYAAGGRRGLVGPRRCGRVRGMVAGAMFGGVLVGIEPTFAVLLGADPVTWSDAGVWLAAATTSLGCAIVGLFAASGRDTAG